MITIKDIAKAANVSTSTASRALNDNARISKDTRQWIQAIAAKLGYVPNDTARNLSLGQANIVGLVLPVTENSAPANPFHLDLMRGVSAALTPRHYSMALAIGQSVQELLMQVKSLVRGSNIHKFLVFYTAAHDPITEYLRANKIDFVVIGHPTGNHGDRFVDSDNVAAGQAATQQLLNNHPKLSCPVFIRSSYNWVYEQDRASGYKAELLSRGLVPHVFDDPNDANKVKQLLAKGSKVDSIVAADDLVYLQFVHTAQSINCFKSQPTICFNNSKLLGMLMPEISKVDLLPQKIGAEAVELLFDPLRHEKLVDFAIKG